MIRTAMNCVTFALVALGLLDVAACPTAAYALDPAFPNAPQMLQTAQAAPGNPDAGIMPPAPLERPKPRPAAPLQKTAVKPAVAVAPWKPAGAVAKSAAALVSPETKRAITIAALTGQDVPPPHHHVSIDVPPTECPGNPDAIGLSRIIKVDTTGGFYVGQTYHTKMPLLNPREVILTFDDGPYPSRTDRILATLKHECLKATFFMIGQMAKAFPAEARKVANEGMTIGYHTMTHSYKLAHGPLDQSQLEISSGWKAVDQAVYGQSGDKPMTHFFRYPGLFNNRGINQWFNSLNMGVFAIDAAGSDWLKGHYTQAEAPAVMNEALAELERNNGGILLLHDIKESSSYALAPLLVELKKRGFKIVHIEPMIAPPPIATGPVGPGVVDTAPAPLTQRTVDGFDPAHQMGQESLGKVGRPSDNPPPLPAYATAAKPTQTGPATVQDVPTQSVRSTTQPPAAVQASGNPPSAAKDDDWFSSTAKTFKGIGAAVGLW